MNPKLYRMEINLLTNLKAKNLIFLFLNIYEFQFTGVFHLATNYQHNYNQNNFEKLVEANLILTNWLSDYCISNSIPIIYFTLLIYGLNRRKF